MPWHGTWREIYNNGNYEYLNERQLDQKTNDKDKLQHQMSEKDMQEEFDT